MSPTISIIIPIYNVADWLKECIDSILNQSFTEFEVLLIDDGSSDGSDIICEEYAKKDRRIRVFHKANKGISSARNYGLERANGEWICFVDPDDLFISTDALEIMYNHTNEMIDLVSVGCSVFEVDVPIYKRSELIIETINRNEALLLMYPSENKPYLGYVWAKLFRKEIIDNYKISFKEGLLFKEDTAFVVEYLCHTNNNCILDSSPVYGYRQNREKSITSSVGKSYSDAYLTSLDSVILMRRQIRALKDPSNELLETADHEVVNRFFVIYGYMLKHNSIDISTLLSMRKRIIQEVGIAYYIRFLKKRMVRKISKRICRSKTSVR